jgi:hypothetical protein
MKEAILNIFIVVKEKYPGIDIFWYRKTKKLYRG